MQIALTKQVIRLRPDPKSFDEDTRTCKTIPSRIFNRKEKCWEYPYSAALEIAEKVEAKHISSMSEGFAALLDDERKKYQRFLQVMKQNFVGEHAFLYGHQLKCAKIAEIYERFAFFMDTGKSLPLMLVTA